MPHQQRGQPLSRGAGGRHFGQLLFYGRHGQISVFDLRSNDLKKIITERPAPASSAFCSEKRGSEEIAFPSSLESPVNPQLSRSLRKSDKYRYLRKFRSVYLPVPPCHDT